MKTREIQELLEAQRRYFKTGATLPVDFRLSQLRKLYAAVKQHEKEVLEALNQDLGKSAFEGFMSEAGLVLSEISYMLRHTRRFARRKAVRTPLSQFHSRSFQQAVPYGNTLIMSPWNYPFLLTITPLANAIAAGNTAIVKPSAYSPATGAAVQRIIAECFDPEYVAVITGGRAENTALLDQKFDFIFFTGSQAVGREVLRRAAEHLTPAVLELGGKSPCIVDASANLGLAARRIVFGKYLNCGQTCVAPDYILCEASVKDRFVSEVTRQIREQYGEKPLENRDYGRIVNRKHFDRLRGLIDLDKVVVGGEANEAALQIAPTVMDGVTWDDAVMGEEIFGPIMPILTFDSFDAVVSGLKDRDKPLALYLFSSDRERVRRVTGELTYGAAASTMWSSTLPPAKWALAAWGRAAWAPTMARTGLTPFPITSPSLTKRPGWTCPYGINPIGASYTKSFCIYF